MRTRLLHLATCALLATACGSGDDASPAIDAAPGGDAGARADAGASADAAAGALVLSSSAFVEGGAIPTTYSCQGANLSPPLAWTGGPSAAGYALVLTDQSNDLIHAVMWDIPASVGALPEGVDNLAEPSVPAGAKQTLAYDQATRGYLGPCPPSTHTYQFALSAVDQAPLSGVTLDSSRAEVVAAIAAHATATATLTGTFSP